MNKLYRTIRISRRRANEGHLGLWRQFGEMATLRTLHGLGPGYYQVAGLWRRELSWQDKTNHLSEREYQRRIALLNPEPYRMLSHNKIAEKAILTLFGIPTPRFLGRLHRRVGSDTAGRPLRNAADLERLVSEQQATRLVFKPPEGMRGQGVHIPIIERRSSMTFQDRADTRPHDVDSYCAESLGLDKGTDWVVQEYFEQHPVLSALNPASVNTVRIWVADLAPKGYQMILAHMRIGRQGSQVDNIHSGGIVASIDRETGRLGAARNVAADFNLYPRHPDHDAPIQGIQLPYWSEVPGLAQRALSVFPHLRFAGLDVAIGPSGPVVLELNLHADRDGAQLTGSPIKVLLKPD